MNLPILGATLHFADLYISSLLTANMAAGSYSVQFRQHTIFLGKRLMQVMPGMTASSHAVPPDNCDRSVLYMSFSIALAPDSFLAIATQPSWVYVYGFVRMRFARLQ